MYYAQSKKVPFLIVLFYFHVILMQNSIMMLGILKKLFLKIYVHKLVLNILEARTSTTRQQLLPDQPFSVPYQPIAICQLSTTS